jgi:glutamate-ammonia-ligase adenylyltransferase
MDSMDVPALIALLDQPDRAAQRLASWGIADAAAARRTLVELAETGLPLELLAHVSSQLAEQLPKVANPDRALAAFRGFLLAARSPLALAALIQRDRSLLPLLLRVLDASPLWCELLVRDPEAFDLLRMTDGQPAERSSLLAEISLEVASCAGERAILAALRRVRSRELLRIGYGDIFHNLKLELVTEQLTLLADALIEAAMQAARRKLQEQRPAPRRADGRLAGFAAIALGRLGGGEMDYGSPVELLFICDSVGGDETTRRAAADYFDRLAKLIVRYLAERTPGGVALDVVTSLRPQGNAAALAWPRQEALAFFDGFGRTWHRQAFVRARAVAGDLELGRDFLTQLQPWVYRQYLSPADENGVKSLKWRIQRHAQANQPLWRDLSQACGGARSIEAVVEFLQLLNGGDLPGVRAAGTLAAIAGLEQEQVLSVEERNLLEQAYHWLRRLEHRLQVLSADQSTNLPCEDDELARISASLAIAGENPGDDLPSQHRAWLGRSWSVLARLLDSAFPDDAAPSPEVALLLDPDADSDEVERVLGAYGFRNTTAAQQRLQTLASEQIPFLSTRRCRHFLSEIARPLLTAIAGTPEPDFTLDRLTSVSNSLGGKGVLWQLFHAHRPSLQLYVRLCGAGAYLANILIGNPGMIDDLVEALQLRRLPTRDQLERNMVELSRGIAGSLPMLHGFKNANHLRIGVRDILDKDDVEAIHQSLADVADICLTHVAELEYARLIEKHGQPTIAEGPRAGEPCGYVALGLGKLGGAEPNYHSTLEVAFLYEADGLTRPLSPSKRETKTTNQIFFAQLAQRVVKEVTQLTPQGRLYNVGPALRWDGGGAATAISLPQFSEHFASGRATLGQWQTLCKARPIFGSPLLRKHVVQDLRGLLQQRPWSEEDAAAMRQSRLALEAGAGANNLKRGAGGTVDVEYAVQLLQLRHAAESPAILVPGTLAALAALATAGHLSATAVQAWSEAYRLLRRVESAVRLLNGPAQHRLPDDPIELRKLALLLQYSDPQRLHDECCQQMHGNRERFARLFKS